MSSPSASSAPLPMLRQMFSVGPTCSVRRPLRSSPLTGPSLNLTPDGIISELNLAPLDMSCPKPSRISSTPDRPSFNSTTTKKSSKRISSSVSNIPLPATATIASPPLSPSHRSKSRDSFMSLPLHEHGPYFPRVYAGSRSLPASPNASHISVADTCWITSNPYGSTPTFSRLSLDSIVMPVSAKEKRNLTAVSPVSWSGDPRKVEKRKSISSLFSKASLASLPPLPPSNPPSIRSTTSMSSSKSIRSMASISSLPSLPPSNPPSIRSPQSIHSLRSIASFRSRSYSTSSSDCGVIAEIQDDFAQFAGRPKSYVESINSGITRLPSPSYSLNGHSNPDDIDPVVEDCLPLPLKRVSSLPKLSMLLRRRSKSVGSFRLSSSKQAEPVTIPSAESISDIRSITLSDFPDVPCDIEPFSAISTSPPDALPEIPFQTQSGAGNEGHGHEPESDFVSPEIIKPHHKKGASFISFTSSDEHHGDLIIVPEVVTALPPAVNLPSRRKSMALPPPGIPIPLPPPLVSLPERPHKTPTTPSSRRQTLTPSSPSTSESGSQLLTPTNLSGHKTFSIDIDDSMSMSPPASPVSPRPTSWTSSVQHGGSASVHSSTSFTSIPMARRAPSTMGSRNKAMSLLGIGDLPPSSAHSGNPPSNAPLPPLRMQTGANNGSVRKFFRALTRRKSSQLN